MFGRIWHSDQGQFLKLMLISLSEQYPQSFDELLKSLAIGNIKSIIIKSTEYSQFIVWNLHIHITQLRQCKWN